MEKALDPGLAAVGMADFSPVSPAPSAVTASYPTAPTPFNNTMSNHQQTDVHVNVAMPSIHLSMQSNNTSFFVRAMYFLFVGWWMSFVFITIGYLCVATILLAPVGFWFLNRVPQVQTLRARSRSMATEFRDNAIYFTESRAQQHPWYLRLVYFPVGLVVGLCWLYGAWLLSLTIVLLPVSIWMVDRSPQVITLQKN